MKRVTNLLVSAACLLFSSGLAALPSAAQNRMMSIHEMMGRMNGMIGRMQTMAPMLQGNQQMENMMGSMKAMGGTTTEEQVKEPLATRSGEQSRARKDG